MVVALRLAHGGWWGGNPESILRAPADMVMNAMGYENFKSEFESEMVRLNRAES